MFNRTKSKMLNLYTRYTYIKFENQDCIIITMSLDEDVEKKSEK